jgi:hypothetical protein
MKTAHVLWLLLLAACAIPEPTLDVRSPLPIELEYREASNGLVLLSGRVNHKQDVSFVLDTGAPSRC